MTSSLSSRNRRATITMHGGKHHQDSRLGPRDEKQHKLTKALLNVNIRNSLGHVHLVMSSENTVGELIRAAIEIYVKEKRRPLLTSVDPLCYELHYSQFSLESLEREEKLVNLGCRSFFVCPKPSTSSCAKATPTSSLSLTKLMDFVL
ncbi:unnamed protein product [Withania somnifera]